MKPLEVNVRLKKGVQPSQLSPYLIWTELDLENGAYCKDKDGNLIIYSGTGVVECKRLTQEVLDILLRLACRGLLEFTGENKQ